MADLTTLTKVKSYLGISNSTHDTLLSSIITSVSAGVESFCGRRFGSASYTEYYDTDGETKIFLPNYPVTTLTSVKYQGGTWDNITWFDYPTPGYLLTGEQGRISFAGSLPTITKYLQIVYTGGYLIDFANETNPALHTLPFDLTQIVNELIASTFNTRTSGGISNMSTEGQSITFSTQSITKDYQNKLARYINYK
jgi:uncharacterized phiE125 gp8 family phage protein